MEDKSSNPNLKIDVPKDLPKDLYEFSAFLSNEINEISMKISDLWHKYIEILSVYTQDIAQYLEEKHNKLTNEAFSLFVNKNEMMVKAFPFQSAEGVVIDRKNIVNGIRESLRNLFSKASSVTNNSELLKVD